MFDFLPPEIISAFRLAFGYIYDYGPIWLPLAFIVSFFNAWVYFRRSAYWQKLGSVLLEIRLPREIFKSPAAMEIVLGAMHQTADESGWYWKYWKGQTRSWFSLEIASFGGDVHFYVWCRKKYQTSIENHIYSQYPGVEVHEVEDYTKSYYFDPNKHNLWACEWKLTMADPFPIKTYIDYGLNKDPKEEYKVDPLASMLEFLGSTTSGQSVWFQILIRAHVKDRSRPLPWSGAKKTKLTEFKWSEDYDAWQEEAKEEIDKIIKKFRPEGGPVRMPTEGEKSSIEALERSITKFPFDVGIRTIYIAEKEKYSATYIGGIIGSFKQFGSPGSNGFSPKGWLGYFDRPWKKWFRSDEKLKPLVIEEYKLRRYFFSPYRSRYFYSKPFILNIEELATLFHLPGAVVGTPTLSRVPSKKSEAPSNLPT